MDKIKNEIERIAEIVGAQLMPRQVEGLAEEIRQLRDLKLEEIEPITVLMVPEEGRRNERR